MSRPETGADLPDYMRKPYPLVEIYLHQITADPAVGALLLRAVAVAAASTERLVITRRDTEMVSIGVPLTDDEIAQRVANVQKLWDDAQARYSSPAECPAWMQLTVDQWALDEDLPLINWDEVAS